VAVAAAASEMDLIWALIESTSAAALPVALFAAPKVVMLAYIPSRSVGLKMRTGTPFFWSGASASSLPEVPHDEVGAQGHNGFGIELVVAHLGDLRRFRRVVIQSRDPDHSSPTPSANKFRCSPVRGHDPHRLGGDGHVVLVVVGDGHRKVPLSRLGDHRSGDSRDRGRGRGGAPLVAVVAVAPPDVVATDVEPQPDSTIEATTRRARRTSGSDRCQACLRHGPGVRFIRTPFGRTYGHDRKMVESRLATPGRTMHGSNRVGALCNRAEGLSTAESDCSSSAAVSGSQDLRALADERLPGGGERDAAAGVSVTVADRTGFSPVPSRLTQSFGRA